MKTRLLKYIIQYTFACLLLFSITGIRADGEDILARKFKFSKVKGSVYQLLMEVSTQSGYQFIYDSKIVKNNQPSVLPKGEYTIGEAVKKISTNQQLKSRIVGKHILLYLSPEETDTVPENKNEYFIIEGHLYDRNTSDMIPHASINIDKTSIGTVSNLNGYFKLKLPDSLLLSQIKISHIAYHNEELETTHLIGKYINLALTPQVTSLQETVVQLVDPFEVVKNMIKNKSVNYSKVPMYLTSFYREGSEYKKKNISLTEAVLTLYKTSYQNNTHADQAKLLKMRHIVNPQNFDLLITKLKAGVNSCLQLDILKSKIDFIDLEHDVLLYNYQHKANTFIDGRTVYEISFKPKAHLKIPLYQGILYIDAENYALIQAQFEISPAHVQKATSMLVTKSSRKTRLVLQKAIYTVSYKPLNNTYYISHIRGDLHFKVKPKKWASSSDIHVWLEMVTCEIDTLNVTRFDRTDRLSSRSILSDTKFVYDDKFWGNFNVIMPEDKLREFVISNLTKDAQITISEETE